MDSDPVTCNTLAHAAQEVGLEGLGKAEVARKLPFSPRRCSACVRKMGKEGILEASAWLWWDLSCSLKISSVAVWRRDGGGENKCEREKPEGGYCG